MRKKWGISAVLVMLLLLSACGPGLSEAEASSSPGTSTEAPVSVGQQETGVSGYYAAYAEIVEIYQERYGQGALRQTNLQYEHMTSLLGVCVTMLMDFDRDGTEELLMIWSESDALLCPYSYGIWTSLDGRTAVQLCENPIFSGAQSYGPFLELVERDEGIYIGEEVDAPDSDGAHTYRKVNASGLSDELTLVYPSMFSESDIPTLNGGAAAYDDLEKAQGEFLSGAEVTRIDLTSWSVLEPFTDRGLPGNGTTADEEEQFFQSILHDTQDTIASLSGETVSVYSYYWSPKNVYSTYSEVIGAHLGGYGEPQILPSSRYDGEDDVPALGGLCVVRLADMDRDGTEELILAWPQVFHTGNHQRFSYVYSIWTKRDGKAVRLTQDATPDTAYEPSLAIYTGSERTYLGVSFDTNTEEATSIANVEYSTDVHQFNGENLIGLNYQDIPEDARNGVGTEYINFSAWSYRWAYGMDWDTDSMLAIGKTQETISAIYNSGI